VFAVWKVLVPQLGPEPGRPRRVPPYLELTTDVLLEVFVDAVIGLVPLNSCTAGEPADGRVMMGPAAELPSAPMW